MTQHSVFTIQFAICRLNYLPSSYNLFLNILRWEGWNFNRQLLLRLHRHEKKPHLQNTPAPPCDCERVHNTVCERRDACVRTVCIQRIRVCSCTVQACQEEPCISFVKSRWLCDLVLPAVIWAFSVSHLIAECQSGKRSAPECTYTQRGAQDIETSKETPWMRKWQSWS